MLGVHLLAVQIYLCWSPVPQCLAKPQDVVETKVLANANPGFPSICIIKAHWNTQTEGLWANLSRNKNFMLIMHEHLFVFRKPALDEKLRPYAESMKWW